MSRCAGIVSCLAYSPLDDGLLAAGAYSGIAALYDTRTLRATCVLAGHVGGITQARGPRTPQHRCAVDDVMQRQHLPCYAELLFSVSCLGRVRHRPPDPACLKGLTMPEEPATTISKVR